MKKQRYIVLIALLLCTTMLAGCSCAPAGAASSSSLVAADDDAGSASTAVPAAEPTPDPAQEQSFTGIIDSAGMGVYYVMLDDGLVIEVPQDGLDDSGLTDTMPGVNVTVTYRGTLSGNDTSGITFISIANA